MPLFKQLRRRSKANFHPSKSAPETKSNESQSNGDMTSGKSSSTLETASYSSLTPPSSIKPTLSSPNLPSLSESNGTSNNAVSPLSAPPQRPGLLTAPSQRNSAYVSQTHTGCGSSADHLIALCSLAVICLSMGLCGRLLPPLLMRRGSFPSPITLGFVLLR